VSTSTATTTASRARTENLARVLESAGWTIEIFDVDLTTDHARVQLRCGPLRVTFDGSARSHTIEREIVAWVDGPRRYSGRWDVTLLGRKRVDGVGWRGGLRLLSTYLADNGARSIAPADVRRALAPLMG
jgi:hypothetical protein